MVNIFPLRYFGMFCVSVLSILREYTLQEYDIKIERFVQIFTINLWNDIISRNL